MIGTTFTPGPWHLSSGGWNTWAIYVQHVNIPTSFPGGRAMCICTSADDKEPSYGEHTPNAHLIAAAPDLYAACEIALTLLTDMDAGDGEAGRVLRTAMAKARGAA